MGKAGKEHQVVRLAETTVDIPDHRPVRTVVLETDQGRRFGIITHAWQLVEDAPSLAEVLGQLFRPNPSRSAGLIFQGAKSVNLFQPVIEPSQRRAYGYHNFERFRLLIECDG